jgi:hypothetical protein
MVKTFSERVGIREKLIEGEEKMRGSRKYFLKNRIN